MDEKKEAKSTVGKVYFEGQWKKQEGITWAFFDEEKNGKPKKPEVKKEELLKTEKKETSGQDKVLKEENHEIISITDIGLSSTDPRYQKKSIETKKTPPPKKEKEKKIKSNVDATQERLKKKPVSLKGSSGKFSDMMVLSQKKHYQAIEREKDLLKIKGVIRELGSRGFSFLSLIFDRDTTITDSNIKKMSKLLKYDPALSLKILQIANTAYYGLPKKTFNVVRALNVIGLKQAQRIVYRATSPGLFESIKRKDFLKKLWYHSIGTGLFCSFFAEKLGFNEDELFMAGMMHDIGKIILYVSLTKKYEEVINLVKEKPVLFYKAEEEVLGLNHSEAGKMALESWNLPELLIYSAQYHHDLEIVQNQGLLKQLAIIQASDALCNLSKIGSTGAKRIQLLDIKTKKIIGKFDSKAAKEEALKKLKEIEMLLHSF